MNTVAKTTRVPVHGSYINDIAWSAPDKAKTGIRYIMSFHIHDDNGFTDPLVVKIITGFFQRAYPGITEDSTMSYVNKHYTAVARSRFSDEVLFVYKHDYSWQLVAVSVATLKAAVNEDEQGLAARYSAVAALIKHELAHLPEC